MYTEMIPTSDSIGVIVPVYKTEKYVAECIESILAQTYTNFRLILVDDGSPDGAGTICDEYATKDSRITVIHQENAGVTRARARGVEEAADCEWITFVDSDDSVTNNALELLLSGIKNGNDIIIIDYDKKLPTIHSIAITTYRNYLFAEQVVTRAPWGRLFRRNLFDQQTFEIPRNIVIAEDLVMNIRLSFKTRKDIQIIHNEIYNYRVYNESTIQSHIRTPKNEQECHEEKMKFLPEAEIDKCIPLTITPRLLRFNEFWGYKYSVKGMKDSQFYQALIIDIKKVKYPLSFIDKLIIYCSNPVVRIIAINLKKIRNIFAPR